MADQRQPRKARHAATLADVGREAGVSVMAVSAVLNGSRTSSRIADETRARILAAAAQLRYRANATARALQARRMNTLGVVTTLTGEELNQYFLEVFNGIVESAAAAGQNTTVFVLPDWRQAGARLESICDGRIDGLILLAPLLDAETINTLPDHTPLVSVHANQRMPGVVNIESEEATGAQQMVQHLLAMGHRRILHLGGPTGMLGAQRRLAGYLSAHAAAGLQPQDGCILHGEFSVESGHHQLETWLQQHAGEDLPQAIFAASDAIALGCMDALIARGLQVPTDITVVGFDDTLLARASRLATVRQPLREMGHRAVDLLVRLIVAKQEGHGAALPDNLILPTEVVLGRSLGPPRSGPLPIR
jgi:LacI family transcriptional regulator